MRENLYWKIHSLLFGINKRFKTEHKQIYFLPLSVYKTVYWKICFLFIFYFLGFKLNKWNWDFPTYY